MKEVLTCPEYVRKNSLSFDEAMAVPAECYVRELDLTETDRREISNHPKEGWIFAYVDVFNIPERKKIDEVFIKCLKNNYSQFMNVQRPWMTRSFQLTALEESVTADSEIAREKYTQNNSPRYRIAHPLMYPEMTDLNLDALIGNQEDLKLIGLFFSKAEEIARENFNKFNVKGLIDFHRVRWAEAKRQGVEWSYEPCYSHLVPSLAIQNS